MSAILATSEAESFGYLVGTIISVLLLVFAVFAVKRAITKRTTGWVIVAILGVGYVIYIIYATVAGAAEPEKGASQPPPLNQTQKSSDWRTFHSPDGDFSVEVPGQLADKSKTVEGTAGKVDRFRYTMVADLISYSAERSDFVVGVLPSQPLDKFFEGFKESRLASMKGRLLEESRIELSGAKGIQLKFEVQEGKVIVVSRSYMLGDSLYSVIVVTSPSLISSPAVQRFFTSFRLSTKPR